VSQFAILLDDKLYKLWHDFKHNRQTSDISTLECLLSYCKYPIGTNLGQLERVGITDATLIDTIARSGVKLRASLEELVSSTRFKIILSQDNSDFPYINIHQDCLFNLYCIQHTAGQNRDKSKQYLKALLLEAKEIYIRDTYFFQNWKDTKHFFDLLPKRKLNIWFIEDREPPPQSRIKEIKQQYADCWTVRPTQSGTYGSTKRHDRYLIVTDTQNHKTEIVITSGFSYLFDNTKECTLMIRPIST